MVVQGSLTVLVCLVSSESSLLDLPWQPPHYALTHILLSYIPAVSSLLIRVLVSLDQGLTLTTSFNLHYHFRGPMSRYLFSY